MQDKKKTKMTELVDWHLNRLDIEDKESARHNLLNVFMPSVLELESSAVSNPKNWSIKNQNYTGDDQAKGGFQFKPQSLETALNRLSRRQGSEPWMEEAYKHLDASQLTPQQQQLVFIADMLEKDGSDDYMREVMKGDKQGSIDAYYKLHHMAGEKGPDDATINRTEKIFNNVYDTSDKENSKDETMEKVMIETNQIASDQIAKQLVGFKGFARTLQLMFDFEPDSNDKRNKGEY